MTNTYNTLNPLGSTSAKDLSDNASDFDEGMNSLSPSFYDRFKRRRETWAGMEKMVADFLEAMGFEATHLQYVDGTPLSVLRPTQLIDRAGSVYKVKMPAAFPVMLTGTWATDQNLLVDVGDASLRMDLANSADPAKGAAMVARTMACLPSVVSLLTASTNNASQNIEVFSYHASLGYGGGVWRWDSARAKSEHNGAYIVSNTVPWNGSTATLGAFLAGTGETLPAGLGCWVKQDWRDIKLVDFGVVEGLATDNSAAWQAAVRFAAKNHRELIMPDFLVRIDTMATVRGDIELFNTVKIRGTFSTTGTALGYVPGRCGSVIYGNGNSILEIQFNHDTNENWDIRGVGFVDASQYPAGTPNATVAPVRILKGRADGSLNRYITGNVFEDCAFNGYVSAVDFYGMVPASYGSNAYLLNYIGPTTFNRTYVSNCSDAIRLFDCTMNHLWVNSSVWFSMTGFGVRLIQTGGGSGGNVSITIDGMVAEAMYGAINTVGGLSGAGVPGAGERRNKLVLRSYNREYTGLFGPSGVGLPFTGNPLGYTGNTDIEVAGVWTDGIAYGELTLPGCDVNSTISSLSPATFTLDSSASCLTPETVNHYRLNFNVPASGSITKVLRGAVADSFLSTVTLFFADGVFGFKTIKAAGIANSSKYQEVSGTVNAALTFTVTSGSSGDYCSIQITNASAVIISCNASIVNTKGNGTLV